MKNNLGTDLIESVKSDSFKDLSIDIFEATMDSFLNEGLYKEVPIVSTIINMYNGIISIPDKLFIAKILGFLQGVRDINYDEREEIINKIFNSEDDKQRYGKKILYILESCEDDEIAKNIGVLFTRLLKEEITREEFFEIASILKKISQNKLDLFLDVVFKKIDQNKLDMFLDKAFEKNNYLPPTDYKISYIKLKQNLETIKFEIGDMNKFLNLDLFYQRQEALYIDIEKEWDHKVLMEGGKENKIVTEGGEIYFTLNPSGLIIYETFSENHKEANKSIL